MRRLAVALLTAAFGLALVTQPARAGDAPPTVSGPVAGEPSFLTTAFDLASVGYEKVEYFISGTATKYEPVGTLDRDGKWEVSSAGTAPFTTRVIVFRPVDPQRFDGTVDVEWLNVSAGVEVGPGWTLTHNEIIRAGAAWVGVSAQEAGVQGGAPTVGGAPPGGLKAADPARYASLSHPGDAYSYDMFTQVARAVRDGGAAGPLGGLDVQRVIAMGESQSAFRMVTYINAVQPISKAFDGFLVHSRSRSGAGLASSASYGLGDPAMPKTALLRDDTDVPVLVFQSETDVTLLESIAARQPDSKRLRLWEVAGTAHADAYLSGVGYSDVGDGRAEVTLLDPTNAGPGALRCAQPINTGPTFAVLSAALHHLEAWVRDGTPPPKAPRFETTGGRDATLKRDEHGNVLGGIRTGQVEAPIATITGGKNRSASAATSASADDDRADFCRLFGTTTPFDAAAVAALYPSRDVWVQQFSAATDQAVEQGFLLQPEADHYKAAAQSLPLPLP
jgi:hypothetical protein